MPAGASWARANVAAKAAWLLPLAGLAVVGFAEKGRALLPVSDTTLIVLAGSMAALGLVASRAPPARPWRRDARGRSGADRCAPRGSLLRRPGPARRRPGAARPARRGTAGLLPGRSVLQRRGRHRGEHRRRPPCRRRPILHAR